MVGGEFEETVKVNRWKRKTDECSIACHLSTLRCPPPIPASPRLRGLNNCSWWGGKCSLCSFSVPLGVLPTLTTLAISCCLTLWEFHTHRNTNTHTNTQALCSIWTLFTFCSLSSSYVGLFVAAVPELGEENRENKAREKTRMEKRGPRWWWRRGEGRGWMGERERDRGKELMFTLRSECRLLLLAEHRSASVTAWFGGSSPAANRDSSMETWQRL